MTTGIPLVDLQVQHSQVSDAVAEGWEAVLKRADFILGEDVAEFEREFAQFCGVVHCIGAGNGTDALELALQATGTCPGDEVVLPVNSFIASATAVARLGATPVLVDVDPATLLINPAEVCAMASSRVTAIMPVHLYGQMAPMGPILEVAQRLGIAVLEDAAQAHGAAQHGTTAGGFGLAAATSFYPSKNLGAYGDGGAVLTSSNEVAAAVRVLRNYGDQFNHSYPRAGVNSRLDSLQAVVLRAKLVHLARWNALRREAANRYHELLADVGEVVRPSTADGNEHVWHLYVVRIARRDAVLQRLKAAGIGAGVHYPVPIHLQNVLPGLAYKEGDFPIAEAAAKEILSLPMYPEITPSQQERVVEELRRALR